MRQHSVLCIIIKEDKVLLGLRKRNPRKGTWSGYGGKIEKGESPEEAIRREVFEEAHISIAKPVSVGTVTFSNSKVINRSDDHVMYLFLVNSFTGSAIETEEMVPEWFPVEEMPYQQMSITDQYWMPPILQRHAVDGYFKMDQDYKILDFKVRQVQ